MPAGPHPPSHFLAISRVQSKVWSIVLCSPIGSTNRQKKRTGTSGSSLSLGLGPGFETALRCLSFMHLIPRRELGFTVLLLFLFLLCTSQVISLIFPVSAWAFPVIFLMPPLGCLETNLSKSTMPKLPSALNHLLPISDHGYLQPSSCSGQEV